MTTRLIGVGLGVFAAALLLVAAFELGQRTSRRSTDLRNHEGESR